MNEHTTTQVHQWLLGRGISNHTIQLYRLRVENDGRIVIPVYSQDNGLLFRKYRRNPFSDEGPKYTYERGSTSALYGIQEIEKSDTVIICEGELDALRLASEGFCAVSSTGGSATFKNEWVPYFQGKEVFICYDNDEPGIRGAYNVQAKIDWAKIIWLPKFEGKDVTDFFLKYIDARNVFNGFIEEAKTYRIPLPLKDPPTTKKAMKALIKEDELEIGKLMEEARELRAKYQDDKHLKILIDYYLKGMYQKKKILRYMGMGKNKVEYGNRIAAAKQVPIDRFIQFNREKFAPCIWHKDSHPSMYHYEKQGRVKCFSCGKLGDVIDVVRQMNGVELKEALDIILK